MIHSPPLPFAGHLWAGLKVGLLGGSFNPAHDGHRHISLYAMKHLGLDAVWWMVSPQNPLKSAKDTAPLAIRMAQAQDVSRHPKIVVTDIETKLGTRFTVDTLKKLHEHFPATRFVWLMGTDNLNQLPRWRRWRQIFETTPVCVLARPPKGQGIRTTKAGLTFQSGFIPENKAKTLLSAPLPAWTLLHIPLNELSSTAIRQSLQNGK